MAQTILFPVANFILGKASDLAKEQIGLLWNFRRELNKFEATISTIQAVLRDAEEKQFHNHQVKDWLEKLSEVMYDAEDLLDDLATEARMKAVLAAATEDGDGGGSRRSTPTTTCCSVVCFLFSSLAKQLVYDLKMAHAIMAIREKLDDIAKDKDALHLEVDTTEEEALSSRETDSCPPTIVVGREDDKKNIIELLLNCNPEANISVVPIVGMGGMGKTTLAQLVYDDDQVQHHFDIKAWVYVSQSFDVKVILRKMLQSIDRESQAANDLDVLQTRVREVIKGKRFLFVLDDVWEETNPSWETLGKHLTIGAAGSKVLVTTRSTKVAEVGGRALKSRTSTSIVEPYRLKGLSDDESWQILEEKGLPRQVPAEVQDVGKQILRQCGGVPLAVSTIAGMLADSTDPGIEWPSFLQKGFSGIMNEGEADSVMAATLQVSFNHLPSHMKHCFTYCGLFGKGFEFKIPMLVQFWVAQGYIESEDKGYDCFKTLWWRSFFQEVEMDGLGNLSKCRMHDLMHDLVDSLSGENIIRSSSIPKDVPSKVRHLYIIGDRNYDPSREDRGGGDEIGSSSKVRTLICHKNLSIKELEQVFNNFLRLRVLVIFSYAENAYTSLNLVGKLKHLRYLDVLGFDNMKYLPDSVTNLVNLQVLNLAGGRSLEELPRDIKKLVSLKHLYLDFGCQQKLMQIPKGIGELKFLQRLSTFAVGKRSSCTYSGNDEMDSAGLDELEGLNALCGELTIKGLENVQSPKKGVYVLKEKRHLQSLVLEWRRDNDNKDGDDVSLLSTRDEVVLEMLWPHRNLKKLMIYGAYEGAKLSTWLCSLTNLVEFTFFKCEQCEYLPAQFHQLSSLKELTIVSCPMLKGCWWKKAKGNNDHHHGGSDDYYNFDPSMEREEDEETEEEWPHFPCLSTLRIDDCPNLTQIPLFPTVEGKLVLASCTEALLQTMKMKPVIAAHHHHLDSQQNHSSSSSSLLPGTAFVTPLSKVTHLCLEGMKELESLPEEGLRNLTSLQRLEIHGCPGLASLPPAMRDLTSLQELQIKECPLLRERCREGEGEDWPNISHIPYIYTD